MPSPAPPYPLDGISLVAQLRNPAAARRPVIVTHKPGNHAVCDDRWTYIRYRQGGEELYDRGSDAHEWHNLAGNPQYAAVKQSLGKWLPENQGITLLPPESP